jgi:hypothetical protein
LRILSWRIEDNGANVDEHFMEPINIRPGLRIKRQMMQAGRVTIMRPLFTPAERLSQTDGTSPTSFGWYVEVEPTVASGMWLELKVA